MRSLCREHELHRRMVEEVSKGIEPYNRLPKPFEIMIPNAAAIAAATEPDRKPKSFYAKYTPPFARLYRSLCEEIVQRSQWQAAESHEKVAVPVWGPSAIPTEKPRPIPKKPLLGHPGAAPDTLADARFGAGSSAQQGRSLRLNQEIRQIPPLSRLHGEENVSPTPLCVASGRRKNGHFFGSHVKHKLRDRSLIASTRVPSGLTPASIALPPRGTGPETHPPRTTTATPWPVPLSQGYRPPQAASRPRRD